MKRLTNLLGCLLAGTAMSLAVPAMPGLMKLVQPDGRDYGIRVSLDDFGTGFSSLSYLKKLPIDTLKIDKSFIDTVMSDSATRVITESIISMVRTLGLETIAEGVEQEQQYKYLHAIGCDIIQGYYFGRPLPVQEMETLLEEL